MQSGVLSWKQSGSSSNSTLEDMAPNAEKTKQEWFLQEQRVTAWSWHTLLKRRREKEQLSDQWNLGNPSVPDSNLTGSYLWPTPKESCFTVQQQRADGPVLIGLVGFMFKDPNFPVDKRNGDKKNDFRFGWSAVSLTQNKHSYPPKWSLSPSTFSEAVPHFILLKSTDFLKSLCNKTNPCSECTKYLLFSGFFYSSCWVRWQKLALQQPSLNRIHI